MVNLHQLHSLKTRFKKKIDTLRKREKEQDFDYDLDKRFIFPERE